MTRNNTHGASVPAKRVPAVQRAAAILTYLAAQRSPMPLSQVAQATDILPGSCLQILRELAYARLVTFDPRNKTYRLGPGLVELANAVLEEDTFAEAAKPHLQKIADQFGMTATATALCDEQHMACVALGEPADTMSLRVTLGGRVPLLSGAAGRCLAAFGNYSVPELRRMFSKVRWQTPLTFNAWMQQVDEVRKLGYSEDKGVFARGVTTLAVPVFAQNDAIRGIIGVGTITAQLDTKHKERLINALRRSARDISAQL